jgi:competence protein ComEA
VRRRPDPDERWRVHERLRAALPDDVVPGWVPQPDDGLPTEEVEDANGVPDRSEPEPAADLEVSWTPHTAPSDGGLLAAVRRRLPTTVLGGRVAPGRAAVVALLVVAVATAAVVALLTLRARPAEVAAPAVVSSGAPLPGGRATATPTPSGDVVVSVAGAVARPGLVRLPAGSRVDDAVRAAGGLAPGASFGLLNLARRLVDGEQVLVGVAAPAAAAGAGSPAQPGAAVDLNAATVEQLDGLPGVGPVLAQHIVDWRTEHGRFASVDQLREVSGIGESKYAALKNKVTV